MEKVVLVGSFACNGGREDGGGIPKRGKGRVVDKTEREGGCFPSSSQYTYIHRRKTKLFRYPPLLLFAFSEKKRGGRGLGNKNLPLGGFLVGRKAPGKIEL